MAIQSWKQIGQLSLKLRYRVQGAGGWLSAVRKATQIVRLEGMHGLRRRFAMAQRYSEWIRRYDTLSDETRAKMRRTIEGFAHKPLISVLMPVFDPPVRLLDAAIRSVRTQLYPQWELCIADDASSNEAVLELLRRHVAEDPRINVVFREKNGHISAASNSALELVRGEFVALLDHDDLLPEHALFWVADAIVRSPEAGIIYSDEDKIDLAGNRYNAYFKCEWNPELFLSHNMISHLGVYCTALVREVGGFREGLDGSQDYDLALRCSEHLKADQIVHIPRVLYHWRATPGSASLGATEKPYALLAGERALNEHLDRRGFDARAQRVEHGYRVHFAVPQPAPLVSLIVLTRNGLRLIRKCIESILSRTRYRNYEIILVDNDSDDPETLRYFDSLNAEPRVRVLRDERPFNSSALNNAAAAVARGTLIGVVNNGIEVISPHWMDEMVSLAVLQDIGAVGARLWYPDDRLQHGGVVLGVGGVAGHAHKGLRRGSPGYLGRAELLQSVSAVSGACLLIRKDVYEEVGGLNEENLAAAFNDIDFCLRVREAGYRNVWTPYAELYHHESETRGREDTSEKQARFKSEVDYMRSRWGPLLDSDPAYSPNLTLESGDFSLAWPPRIETLEEDPSSLGKDPKPRPLPYQQKRKGSSRP